MKGGHRNDRDYVLRLAKKIMAINFLGGKCETCKNDDILVLEFHHIDDRKDDNVGCMLSLQWSRIKDEAGKCKLLCRNCHSELHHSINKKTKEKLLAMKDDNKCSVCGYDKNIASLDFHHRNPEEKKFNMAHVRSSIGFWHQDGYKISKKQIYEELKKCDIVCKNCHQKLTNGVEKFERLKSSIYNKVLTYKEKKTPDCNRLEQLKIKGSEFRNKLALWLRMWRKYRSVREVARKIGISEITLSISLSYSKWYKKRKVRTLSKRHGANSRYIGVTKTRRKWNAYIDIERKRKNLGNYDCEDDAAHAVDEAYIAHYGNQKRTNFRYNTEEVANIIGANKLGEYHENCTTSAI